jgi:hypothetical protein
MKTKQETEPVEVFAGTAWQAGMVKSLLEDSEIAAFIKDEIMGTLQPWFTAPGGAGSVSVFVSHHDFRVAKTVVAKYEKNLKK